MSYKKKNSRKKIITGKLLLHGLTIPEFSEMYGFKPTTVYKVITRHFGTQGDQKPRGKETLKIINTLEKYI